MDLRVSHASCCSAFVPSDPLAYLSSWQPSCVAPYVTTLLHLLRGMKYDLGANLLLGGLQCLRCEEILLS
jgi:hypothetical protein